VVRKPCKFLPFSVLSLFLWLGISFLGFLI
jgi:hypothetical protein